MTERYEHKWSEVCKTLFQLALELKNEMESKDYIIHSPQRQAIEKRLDRLLEYPLPEDDKGTITFQKRLIKYRSFIFTFLYREEVPADNNGSERAIRNIKLKQKMSGQFKSDQGANTFAILRSVIDTTLKNKGNVLETLATLAQNF